MDLDPVEKMQGKILDARARKIINNVDNYFTKEKEETKELYQQLMNLFKYAQKTNAEEVIIPKQTLAEIIVDLQNKTRIVERVQEATGVSRNTVGKIRIEKEKAKLTGGEIKTPMRRSRGRSVILDETSLSVLRNVLDAYTAQNEIPILRNLRDFAEKELDYKGSTSTLRRIIKDQLGYQFKANIKKEKS